MNLSKINIESGRWGLIASGIQNLNLRAGNVNRFIFIAIILFISVGSFETFSQQVQVPGISVNVASDGGDTDLVLSLQILAVMTVLTLAPSILIMMTCFTRIVIVLHFLKQAMGTTNQPPNQLVTGLALFLTFFIMQPVFNEANDKGIQPYMKDEITQEQAVDNIVQPFKQFMLKQVRDEDLGLFVKLSGGGKPASSQDVSIWALIPAYSISEIRVAFQIGFMLFIPFLVLDMVIASTLMSLGMFLLPPQLISLPIKILLFILVDGWYLIIDSLVKSITN
ncbi:MAG: flagellar type III secretion system pore protein FliP [Candidatus Kapabacteria bacterium]|nr:flagellar type III secretion system pore protein FliP [Ignavibacteriota bacterium]MCW5886179.1 flagellar type III secretion system pore protein FliP [Candidatus Kapabacteria bacterium]